jgi:putative FmdB family regulatory protein
VPIYDYDCTACGKRTEVIHRINEPGPKFCPVCGTEGSMRKAFSAPSILFKGSGWAKVDRRSTSGGSATKAPAGEKSGDGGSSGGGSGDGGSSGGGSSGGGSGDGAGGSGASSGTSGSKTTGESNRGEGRESSRESSGGSPAETKRESGSESSASSSDSAKGRGPTGGSD